MRASEFFSAIRQGKLGPAYFLRGPDRFLHEECRSALIASLPEEVRQWCLSEIEYTPGRLARELEGACQMPMLGGHSFLLFSDPEDFKHAGDPDYEALASYLERPSPFATVVFAAVEPDRRRRFIQLLEKKSEVVDLLPLARREAAEWLKGYLGRAGVQVETDLAEAIAAKFESSKDPRKESAAAGVNLLWARTEVEKLLTARPGAQRLEPADLEMLVAFREEHVIGKLLRTIADRDFPKALKHLRSLLASKESEMLLLWSIGDLFRQALKSGSSAGSAPRRGGSWNRWSSPYSTQEIAPQLQRKYTQPEILAADLTRFALELAAWGAKDATALTLMDTPPAAAWSYAQDLLRELGALDGSGRITAHGRELVRLPTAPRLGHMLLRASQQNLAPTAAWIAVMLEERDAGGDSDLAARLKRLRSEGGGRAREAVGQLLRLVDERDDQPDESALGRVLSWAFPERIARKRTGQVSVYQCEDGGEARLHDKDPLVKFDWLAVAHWDPARARRIYLAAPLDEAEVLADHQDRIVVSEEVRWDAASEAVVAEEQRRLGALVLRRKPLRSEGAREAQRAAMLDGIRQMGIGALPWNEEARQWQARVQSLRLWRESESWPDMSDAALLATLNEWLAPYLDGVTRRAHLGKLDLLEILDGRLDYATRQKLQRLAPTHVEVPTGSRIRLSYQPPNAPALEVKLQEMFGCRDTPAVNEGRTKVVLHLLSPGQRPVAVTQDLAGFWVRGYLDVKKDMKGRYPRHPWPEDPLTAPPTRRAKRRGT